MFKNHGFFKLYPQFKHLWSNINNRCYKEYDSRFKYYGGKGIKNKLSKSDLVRLWDRDKAYKLSQPSLDRKDSNSDYSFKNCRFIEFKKNQLDGLKKAHLTSKVKTPAKILAWKKKIGVFRAPRFDYKCYVCSTLFRTTLKEQAMCSKKCAALFREEYKRLFPK